MDVRLAFRPAVQFRLRQCWLDDIPLALWPYREILLWARWMALVGRLSDYPSSAPASSPTPTSELAGTSSAGSPRVRAT